MLGGKALFRDIWFDKPPLLPLSYLLCGAGAGWTLRLAGALYCAAGVLDRVPVRARPLVGARRPLGGRAARLLPDVRHSRRR